MSVAVSETRERIMQAALSDFLEEGYEQATTARICRRAQVSNGALFHHFASKQAIADALYVEAIGSFQEGLWALLRRRPGSLYEALHGALSHQMRWIEEHPDLARFVYMRGHLDWDSAAGSEVAALNSELAGAMREWMRPLEESGELRPLPMLLLTAIVSGPAHAIARRWLSGQLEDRRPTDFVRALTEAACAALRGTPTGTHSRQDTPPPTRELPRTGHLRIELRDEDGTRVASGEASMRLLAAEGPAPGPEERGERGNPGEDRRGEGGQRPHPAFSGPNDEPTGRGSDT